MMSLRFQGVIPPMITPLTSSGDVDTAATEHLVERLVAGGVDGIFVLGSSGEGPWLTAEQSAEVMRLAVRAAAGRVPVLGGVLESGTRRTLDAIENAAACGVSAVVVTAPYYFEADAQTQRVHFETIARRSPLPIVLYNIPSMTHNAIAPQTVADVLDCETIVGIKDSAGNWEVFAALLALREKRRDFQVLQGAERQSLRSLLAGADGIVPGMGNLAPKLFADLLKCVRAGDTAGAEALQQRAEALWHLHTHGFWLACLKYAVSLVGDSRSATSANVDLAETAKAAIYTLVESANLLAPAQS
ncbi:MAG: dihydrodipicolinate synthase family protein [Anaerolineae bacterium]|nr:dihydrodipicolinate synthase family protein [Anaerolineae bacterium]